MAGQGSCPPVPGWGVGAGSGNRVAAGELWCLQPPSLNVAPGCGVNATENPPLRDRGPPLCPLRGIGVTLPPSLAAEALWWCGTRVPPLRRTGLVPSDHGDEMRLCRLRQPPAAGWIWHGAGHVALPKWCESPPRGARYAKAGTGRGVGLWRGAVVWGRGVGLRCGVVAQGGCCSGTPGWWVAGAKQSMEKGETEAAVGCTPESCSPCGAVPVPTRGWGLRGSRGAAEPGVTGAPALA